MFSSRYRWGKLWCQAAFPHSGLSCVEWKNILGYKWEHNTVLYGTQHGVIWRTTGWDCEDVEKMYFFTKSQEVTFAEVSHTVGMDSVFSISFHYPIALESLKKPTEISGFTNPISSFAINMSDGDQTACNCKCTQGSKNTPMIETTGTICLYLGRAVFPLLPLPFPLPSSSNGFQLSYCPCINLPGSVSIFQ